MEHSWFWISAVLVCISWSSAKEILLYETPDDHWDWNANSNDIPSVSEWSHRTPPNRFELCSLVVTSVQPNNWLLSTVIDIQRIQRVDVAITYTINPPCSIRPSVTFCNDSFDVYVWESDVKVLKDKIPDPISSNNSYRKLTTISGPTSTRKTLTIPLQTKRRYIVLGFRDQVGCETLYSVKVTYNVCPEVTLPDSLVHLQQTVAPSTALESVLVEGKCPADSSHLQGSLNVSCESSGQWNTTQFNGKCVCNEDFENLDGTCSVCSQGTFNGGKGLNCTVIPSHPRNVTVTFVNQSSAAMSWLPPATTGDGQVFYEVECQRTCEILNKDCSKETCVDNTGLVFKTKRDVTSVTMLGTAFFPFVNYTCKIKAKNRVSEIASRKHKVEGNSTSISFKTNGSVPGIPEVFVQQAGDGVIVLSWELKCKNGIIQKYKVTYFNVDDTTEEKNLTTINTKQRIEKLVPGKTYEFQVAAVNNFGTGPPGKKRFKISKGLSEDNLGGLSSKTKMAIAGAAGGGGLLLLILIVVIIVVFRFTRGSRRNIEKEYMRSIEQGTGLQSMEQRRYIDPGNYLHLMKLLSTFTTEIERSKTKLDKVIGQGEFADVYKGTLQTPKGTEIVAIKVLRPGSNEKSQKDFLSEASIMGQFEHPNVIALRGVVTQSRPMMILTEFLESGSLDNFLKARKGQFTAIQLLGMARGVANGMIYLSEMNFIHRDLAARNILVGENMSCKVSDFGLSRELTDDKPDSEYETQGGKIPVRWTAPEALQHRKFSSASDVWSYGILLWEIMSFAERPYWDWNNYDVIGRVDSGYRLPPPTGCPKVVYELMLECWKSDKNKRPKFAEIVRRLDELFRSPEVLKDDLLPVKPRSEKSDLPEFKSVDEWLKFINMEKYSEVFRAANIHSLQKITQLEDRNLKDLGITLIGHRNKLNKSIRSMKAGFVNRGLDEDEAAI